MVVDFPGTVQTHHKTEIVSDNMINGLVVEKRGVGGDYVIDGFAGFTRQLLRVFNDKIHDRLVQQRFAAKKGD